MISNVGHLTTSPLVHAVLGGDLPGAEAALRAGADPNAKDPLGYPPLHLAAARGHVQMVQLLLTAGADPLLPETRTGASALHKAAQDGSVEVARLLLDHGAHIDQHAPLHGNTPMIDAVWHKHLPMVEFLLARGADTEVRGRLGYTAGEMRPFAGNDDMTPYEVAIARARRERAARRSSDPDPPRAWPARQYAPRTMEDLAPDITRQRLLIEGYFDIGVDATVIADYLHALAAALDLRTYGEPTIFAPGGEGRAENQGYDAFIPLIDSGISL